MNLTVIRVTMFLQAGAWQFSLLLDVIRQLAGLHDVY